MNVNAMSLLFNEEFYSRSKWTVDIPTHGFAGTINMFMYNLEKVSSINDDNLENTPSISEIEKFINRVFLKMKLANEICLISLIFIERLMVTSYLLINCLENWRSIIVKFQLETYYIHCYIAGR
jgi:hypothetical protein